MKFIDVGANLTDSMFSGEYHGKQVHTKDLDLVLERAYKAGLDKIIVTAGSLSEAKSALELVKDDARLFTTVGVHPTRCQEFESDPDKYLAELMQLAEVNKGNKVVAIGECGLDYDRLEFCPKDIQKKYFELQFTLSEKTGLPMFLHNRNTQGDFVDMIKKNRHRFTTGVVHSFDGPLEELQELLAIEGIYIGINGCSLKTEDNLKVMSQIPLDRLVIETDAPWCDIRPAHASYQFVKTNNTEITKNHPKKWEKGFMVKGRNEPCNIVQVLEVIAGYRKIDDLAALADQIYNNTCKVFFPPSSDNNTSSNSNQ